MEKIVSDDTNITDELSLSKPEDVEGNEQGGKTIQEYVASVEAKDETKKEDNAIEEAKEEIASPAEDKGFHDTTDVPNTQPAEEVSEASISEDPVEVPKEIAQESFEISNSSLLEIDKLVEPSSQSNANDKKDPVGAPKELEISETATEESTASVSATDDKPPELPYESVAQELGEAVINTNGSESPLEAPKERVISEIVSAEVKGVGESSEVPGEDSSNVVKDDNPVEQVPETVAQEPSEETLVTTTGAAEKPADEEVTADTVEVSCQLPNEELPQNRATEPTECPVNEVHEIAQSESSDIVLTEPKEVQIETIVAELPSQKIDDEAKKKDKGNNIDDEKTTLTETAQSVAEGVEVTEDAENENLQVQNPNLVELSRDIKMVGTETDVPSDNQLETELKPDKQTLLDKFANENTEDKKQETAQVETGTLTEANKDGDAIKAELSGKKSKNIVSKVKQSIVKVKKALIGKSPSSKTMAPEGIDDTKAK